MTIAENLAAVEARIAAACAASGRDRSEVRLLPVSKTHSVDALRAAYAAGVRNFGESKVQEAAEKAEAFAGTDARWVLIGHLQTNKAKQAAEFAHEFQALDSAKIAAELDRRLQAAGRRLDVLIEVNTSAETSKFGPAPDVVLPLARELRAFDALNVTGLMTIAANSDDRTLVASCFEKLGTLRDQLRDEFGGGYDELSMGMSGDYELAIEHGSTCVRVGTAIFGARDYGTLGA